VNELPRGEVYTHDDGLVRLVIMNRPERKNAMTPSMLAAMLIEIERCGREGKAVVVAGEGDSFCAGFDMKMVHDDAGVLAQLLTGLSTVIKAMRRLEVPVVVAAHGAAVAGGCALLGGGDIGITDQAAKLGYPVVKLGVSPAINGPSLSNLTGSGRARERMLDPGLIDGREALRIGLVHICCDIREDVIPKAVKFAKQMAAFERKAWVATKRHLNEIDGSNNDGAFEQALAASMGLVGSEDQIRRVAGLWAKG
jgi:enoyl-CoA hydratase/carnithine racemase